jgi:hypothetical protein
MSRNIVRNTIIFITSALLLQVYLCKGQTDTSSILNGKEFSWLDTSFKIGDKKTIKPRMPLEAVPILFPEENKELLDTLFNFLQKHKTIKIEVGSHTSIFPKSTSGQYAIDYSQRIADMIKKDLIKRGIDSNRINSKGYGEAYPIVPQSELDKESDNEQRMRLNWKNSRTEILILTN